MICSLSETTGRQLMPDNSAGEGWQLIVAPWHLDEHIPSFPLLADAPELIHPSLPAGSQTGRMTRLYQAIADAVARAARPLLLSGDCTTAMGAVTGLQRRHGDLAVVWLDGHGDFNTPATTVTGYLGGMPLAMLTGRAPELISDPLGLRPVAESDVVLVDARDLDPAERDTLAASQVHRIPAEPGELGAVLGGLGEKPVYLHVDVDIIDSAQLPGLRVPAGTGPDLTKIEDCLAAIPTAVHVTAACIACTWLPECISDQPAREAITRLAAALGAQLLTGQDAPHPGHKGP
jgi:arginase